MALRLCAVARGIEKEAGKILTFGYKPTAYSLLFTVYSVEMTVYKF